MCIAIKKKKNLYFCMNTNVTITSYPIKSNGSPLTIKSRFAGQSGECYIPDDGCQHPLGDGYILCSPPCLLPRTLINNHTSLIRMSRYGKVIINIQLPTTTCNTFNSAKLIKNYLAPKLCDYSMYVSQEC